MLDMKHHFAMLARSPGSAGYATFILLVASHSEACLRKDALSCTQGNGRGFGYLCCWLIWGRVCRSDFRSLSCCWTPWSCIFSFPFSSSSSVNRVLFLARVRRADSLLLAFLQAKEQALISCQIWER